VLAGDYLFAWIFKNVTAGYPHPVPHILSATLADICDGEVLQLRALGDLSLPLAAYIEVARKKTASLFAASAECGAIMGGGDTEQIDALRAYGDALGVAFQMKDDLLDVTADERSLGKPVGNDLSERKMTIPLIQALASGDDAFREEVRRFYSGSGNGAAHTIVEGIARHGGLAGTRQQIAAFVGRSIAALEPIPPSAAKNELEKLAETLLVE
jgi:octaprenyl-diphosphate synthase